MKNFILKVIFFTIIIGPIILGVYVAIQDYNSERLLDEAYTPQPTPVMSEAEKYGNCMNWARSSLNTMKTIYNKEQLQTMWLENSSLCNKEYPQQ